MIDSIIDISHHNGDVNLTAAATAGIVAVFHKASQGTAYVDPLYAANRTKASDAGLLWGAYHFGTGADGSEQANFFLNSAGLQAGELAVLDFEANTAGPSMDIEEARAFVTHIHDVLGTWPILYTGHYVKDLLGSTVDPVLANCPLWIAQYARVPVIPPSWTSWTFWQWTDGAAGVGPTPVAGVGACDRDRFAGSDDDLRQFWRGVTATV